MLQTAWRKVATVWSTDGPDDEDHGPDTPRTLGRLIEPLLLRMVERALGQDADAMPDEDKKRFASDIVARLGEDESQALLREAGEGEAESAVLKLAVAGGAHGSFAVAVGATGFAPYILAAQASAFIPMVSGPALVSLVSVLANPVVVGTGRNGRRPGRRACFSLRAIETRWLTPSSAVPTAKAWTWWTVTCRR